MAHVAPRVCTLTQCDHSFVSGFGTSRMAHETFKPDEICDSKSFYTVSNMQTARQIAYGFIIFFIIDRASRLISAQWAIKKNLSELETERMRCAIELVALFIALVVFSPQEISNAITSQID